MILACFGNNLKREGWVEKEMRFASKRVIEVMEKSKGGEAFDDRDCCLDGCGESNASPVRE